MTTFDEKGFSSQCLSNLEFLGQLNLTQTTQTKMSEEFTRDVNQSRQYPMQEYVFLSAPVEKNNKNQPKISHE